MQDVAVKRLATSTFAELKAASSPCALPATDTLSTVVLDPIPATMKVPAFSDIGKATKGTIHRVISKLVLRAEPHHAGDLHPCILVTRDWCALTELLTGGKSGTFQYNKALTVSSTTADGVVRRGHALVHAYNPSTGIYTGSHQQGQQPGHQPQGGIQVGQLWHQRHVCRLGQGMPCDHYSIVCSKPPQPQLTLTGSASNIAPGLSAALTGSLPDQSSAKLTVDYAIPHVTLKTAVGLTAAPKVDLAATTGVEGVVVGGDVGYDTSKGSITRWALAAGYTKADYQASLMLIDRGETVKASFTHNVDSTMTVGGEVMHSLTKQTTGFTLGYAKKLDSGALFKARLDNTGLTSVLYEQELKPKTLVALSSQFDATDLNKAPKFGVAFGLKN